jgi:hypothetical protein
MPVHILAYNLSHCNGRTRGVARYPYEKAPTTEHVLSIESYMSNTIAEDLRCEVLRSRSLEESDLRDAASRSDIESFDHLCFHHCVVGAMTGPYYRKVEDQTHPACLGETKSCKLTLLRGDRQRKYWCFQIAIAFFRIAVHGGVLVRYCAWLVHVL